MAVTTKEYTGNGSQGGAGGAQLTFPFEYLKTEDVKKTFNKHKKEIHIYVREYDHVGDY